MDAVGQPLFRFEAEFCYQPTIGGFGLFVWDWTPFPLVTVRFSDSTIDIPSIDRKVGPITVFSTSWSAKYRQIECAESFGIPRYVRLRTLGRSTVPFGIRVRMKESWRARVFLFSRQCNEMLEAFAAHDVPVAPDRRKLNLLFIGRK